MGAFVDRLVTGSTLEADASQAAAIKALSLVQTLACVRPNAETPNLQERGSQPSISGAYLFGPVGSGKTMCLDLFFKTLSLPQAIPGSPFLDVEHSSASATIASRTWARSEAHAPGPHIGPPTADYSSCTPSSHRSPALIQSKRRLHFHEFMLAVHKRLHDMQKARPKVLGRSRLGLPVFR